VIHGRAGLRDAEHGRFKLDHIDTLDRGDLPSVYPGVRF
jgi:hypothetical protein